LRPLGNRTKWWLLFTSANGIEPAVFVFIGVHSWFLFCMDTAKVKKNGNAIYEMPTL